LDGCNVPAKDGAQLRVGFNKNCMYVDPNPWRGLQSNVPSTTQVIANNTTAILANANSVNLSPSSTLTVNVAPVIADPSAPVDDGVPLRLCNIHATNTITLPDQANLASSNIRNGGTNVAIAPGKCVLLDYRKIDVSTGDWFVVGSTSAAFTSPLTTKGDVFGRTTSADTRVAVGANGTVLAADSAQAAGVAYKTISVPITMSLRFGSTNGGTQVFQDGWTSSSTNGAALGITNVSPYTLTYAQFTEAATGTLNNKFFLNEAWDGGPVKMRVQAIFGSGATVGSVARFTVDAQCKPAGTSLATFTASGTVDPILITATTTTINVSHVGFNNNITLNGTCAAGDPVFFQLARDPANAADTSVATMSLVMMELTYNVKATLQ
jgi:hypothetical protein